jgi:hypothetical protein
MHIFVRIVVLMEIVSVFFGLGIIETEWQVESSDRSFSEVGANTLLGGKLSGNGYDMCINYRIRIIYNIEAGLLKYPSKRRIICKTAVAYWIGIKYRMALSKKDWAFALQVDTICTALVTWV